MEDVMKKFFGKYRGIVTNNLDPEELGRIQVDVPAVSGTLPSSWSLPCVPFTGVQSGFFVVPSIGANVWVEFERGDANFPIWTGGFWQLAAEVPTLALTVPPSTQQIVVSTQLGTTLVLSDAPMQAGGILLKSAGGAMISVSDAGIRIDNAKGAFLTLRGPVVLANSGSIPIGPE